MNGASRIYPTMVRKLQAWEITPRAKRVGVVIADLSLALDAWDVELYQREVATLTGLSEACVSKAVSELMEAGVLHRKGARGDRPRVYRLLPNAELVEPAQMIDEAAARGVRAAVMARQQQRCAGDDSRGQIVLLRTDDEVVETRLAEGSAERALDDLDQWDRGRLSDAVRRSIEESEQLACGASPPGNLPGGKVGQLAWEESSPPPGTNARGRTLNVYPRCTTDVKRSDAGCRPVESAAGAADRSEAVYAFELVRDVLDRAGQGKDFEQWERKWKVRTGLATAMDATLQPQAQLVARAAAEVKSEMMTGTKVRNPGGAIVDRVRRWLGPLSATFRLLSF